MSKELKNSLLAVLFAVGEPISPEKIASALELDANTVRGLLEQIRDELDEQNGAFQILNLQGQYQISTLERHTEAVRKVLSERRGSQLSNAAFEVLAAVAYNQPVTRSYIEQVRGVDSSGIVASLTEKGLLEEAGRLDLPGRPIAYRTTAHFLRTFGLSSLDELPVHEIVEDGHEDIDISDGQTLLTLSGFSDNDGD